LTADDIRGYLLPGERILWQGKPDVRGYSLRGSWFMIPFSIMWGGFAIFWEVSVIASGGPLFFALWGVPFVVIGLYMIVGRLFVARHEARNTTYAITDHRVLIVGGAFRRTLVALDLVNLPGAELSEGGGGSGSIAFGTTSGFMRMPPGWPTMGMYRNPPTFQSIPDVRGVFATLQQARSELRAS
jgi:hypothetical protein